MSTAVTIVFWAFTLYCTHHIAWLRGHSSGMRWMGKHWGPILRQLHDLASIGGAPPRMEGDDDPGDMAAQA